jgi:hypothetical protein
MKRLSQLLSVIFLLLSSPISFAQEIKWQNTIGGNYSDWLWSIQPTIDGGYILGGYSNSNISGDKTENCIGGLSDYWMVKTNSSGSIEWQNTIGGNEDDQLQFIQQTSDGGYILGGSSLSNISGDKTENCIGDYDFWIVKTNSTGIVQWQNTIGGTGEDYLYSIQQTTDGGYILGGFSSSNISGDKTENCLGVYDYWIVKTNSTGVIEWQNTIGGNTNDMLLSVKQTPDGGYILGGWSMSYISGDKTETCYGVRDYWIIKTDSIGNIQWQNTIGGSDHDWFLSLIQTSDEGYLLGGYSFSNISGEKTENSNGWQDYWIVKLDSLGNLQWQNTIGGNLDDELFSIVQTDDEGYILGGWSYSDISGDKTENSNGGWDYWVVKTDSIGKVQWQNTIGGSLNDECYSIGQSSDGGLILGGKSVSNISGDKTENCMSMDYWIIKISSTNLINGKLFIDFNSNGTQDSSELSVNNKMVKETNTGKFAFSDQNGSYNVWVSDSGNFLIASIGTINYYNAVPASHTAYFTGMQQTDSLNDFAFQPAGVFNDLCITVSAITPFRNSFNASYMINYENIGTTILNPTVVFYIDTNYTYVTSLPAASTVLADSVLWNLGPLAPFETGSILVTVNIDASTPLNTLVYGNVKIEPIAADADTTCNRNSWKTFTTGSFDPNEIHVSRDTLFTTELSNPDFLDYIIYFQNTGNDTAFNIKVLNPIDTSKLQLSTLEFVASSHPMNMQWIPWERNMEFKFDNILLPDSNVDEPGSHGFVRYRIKPKTTLAANDTIKNTAYIYFDFNAPIVTNTVLTKIVLPTLISNASINNSAFTFFPNPSTDSFTIQCKMKNAELKIFDAMGRTVYQQIITSANQQVTHHFSPGIYFVKVSDGAKMMTKKLVIQ